MFQISLETLAEIFIFQRCAEIQCMQYGPGMAWPNLWQTAGHVVKHAVQFKAASISLVTLVSSCYAWRLFWCFLTAFIVPLDIQLGRQATREAHHGRLFGGIPLVWQFAPYCWWYMVHPCIQVLDCFNAFFLLLDYTSNPCVFNTCLSSLGIHVMICHVHANVIVPIDISYVHATWVSRNSFLFIAPTLFFSDPCARWQEGWRLWVDQLGESGLFQQPHWTKGRWSHGEPWVFCFSTLERGNLPEKQPFNARVLGGIPTRP